MRNHFLCLLHRLPSHLRGRHSGPGISGVSVLVLAAALLLAACGSAAASGSGSEAGENVSSTASDVSASPAASSAAPPIEEDYPHIPSDLFSRDEPYFIPFPAGSPPDVSPWGQPPLTGGDIEAILQNQGQTSWMYDIDPALKDGVHTSYQFRFLPEGRFMTSIGVYGTDAGSFFWGSYTLSDTGELAAIVHVDEYEEGTDRFGAEPTVRHPVYLVWQANWAQESSDDSPTVILTLLSLEDTSPEKQFDYFYHNLIGVPLPVQRYE